MVIFSQSSDSKRLIFLTVCVLFLQSFSIVFSRKAAHEVIRNRHGIKRRNSVGNSRELCGMTVSDDFKEIISQETTNLNKESLNNENDRTSTPATNEGIVMDLGDMCGNCLKAKKSLVQEESTAFFFMENLENLEDKDFETGSTHDCTSTSLCESPRASIRSSCSSESCYNLVSEAASSAASTPSNTPDQRTRPLFLGENTTTFTNGIPNKPRTVGSRRLGGSAKKRWEEALDCVSLRRKNRSDAHSGLRLMRRGEEESGLVRRDEKETVPRECPPTPKSPSRRLGTTADGVTSPVMPGGSTSRRLGSSFDARNPGSLRLATPGSPARRLVGSSSFDRLLNFRSSSGTQPITSWVVPKPDASVRSLVLGVPRSSISIMPKEKMVGCESTSSPSSTSTESFTKDLDELLSSPLSATSDCYESDTSLPEIIGFDDPDIPDSSTSLPVEKKAVRFDQDSVQRDALRFAQFVEAQEQKEQEKALGYRRLNLARVAATLVKLEEEKERMKVSSLLPFMPNQQRLNRAMERINFIANPKTCQDPDLVAIEERFGGEVAAKSTVDYSAQDVKKK